MQALINNLLSLNIMTTKPIYPPRFVHKKEDVTRPHETKWH